MQYASVWDSNNISFAGTTRLRLDESLPQGASAMTSYLKHRLGV